MNTNINPCIWIELAGGDFGVEYYKHRLFRLYAAENHKIGVIIHRDSEFYTSATQACKILKYWRLKKRLL